MKKDPFEEYIKQTEPSKRELGYAWYTAIGLQAVDGLETSDYLKKTAKENINGKITIDEAKMLIESYYEESTEKNIDRTKEADIVSSRIVGILSEHAFTFSVPQYIGIHKRLFEDVFSHAGKIRDYNISKKERVLDGASVHYGNALELREMLEYDIREEKEYEYTLTSISAVIHHLAKFVSRLWQIHAFGEGNTRTTAVFLIKYLRTMGFDVTNDIFAENAWYFRNSLVRANYNDFSRGIRETTEFLELFLKNLLLGETNELKNRYIHIRWQEQKQDIHDEKQDIHAEKQDIEDKKPYIEIPEEVSNKTKQHIQNLFKRYGYDKFFGRTEVMQILSITASPASVLIKKMLDMKIIYPIKGKGKGKYLFRRENR
ncbi:MAG: Fic family protein [Lachnospiraceae bacterium]|nr:Fic family protein [Lachnospiraceae bacterium]